MVLFSRYFNGGLLVMRTIHVVAARSGGSQYLDQVWSGLVSLITDPRQGADTPKATESSILQAHLRHTTLCPSALS